MNLSFKKITALILCVSFISGAFLLALNNANLQKKLVEHSQKSDQGNESENKISEEMQDGKIDYLTNISLVSFNTIRDKFELESSNEPSFFISNPPFFPPKS